MRLKKEILENEPALQIIEQAEDGFAAILGVEKDVTACIIVSWGGGWDHVSVHMMKKTDSLIIGAEEQEAESVIPSWMMMSRMKSIFFYDHECAVQYHPAIKEYVNDHPATLHLWRSQAEVMPTPPKDFV